MLKKLSFLLSRKNLYKMHIKNTTKKTLISKNAISCRNIYSKTIGLMFSIEKSLIFIFEKEKTVPLHMFFVFYPIDVLFLDKNKTVVEKKENFKPFTLYTPRKKAMYVIEVPNGIIKKTKTELRDKIDF